MLRKEKQTEEQKEPKGQKEASARHPHRKSEHRHRSSREKESGKAGLLVTMVLVLVLLVFITGSGRMLESIISSFAEETFSQQTDQRRIEAERAIDTIEQAFVRWAGALRGEWHSSLEELQQAVGQGRQILDCRQLFVVDEDGYFYGSNGGITTQPTYQEYLDSMTQDQQIINHKDENGASVILLCMRLRPFTVDVQSFVAVVAELQPEQLFWMLPEPGEQSQSMDFVLEAGGKTIAQSRGTGLFRQLDEARIPGYSSPELLRREILSGSPTKTDCTIDGSKWRLTTHSMENRDWVYASLSPMVELFPGAKTIRLLFAGISLLTCCGAAAACVLLLRLRERNRLIREKKREIEGLEEKIRELQKDVRTQHEFAERVCHDIRTPLNGVIGFVSLAARHMEEPERAREYLEKANASAGELLSKLEYGLGTEEKAPPIQQTKLSTEVEKPVELAGRRILVVEDNELNREILSEILKESGMLVECAENGQEAFQYITTSRPGYYDLVLMDIIMPEMDGYETTRVIRRLRSKFLAEIPILAMTANVEKEDKQKAFRAGMNGYIEKPINIEKLLYSMRVALEQREH